MILEPPPFSLDPQSYVSTRQQNYFFNAILDAIVIRLLLWSMEED